MQSQSIYEYIFLGTAIRFLQDIKAGYLVWERGYVAENIDSLFSMLTALNLRVTQNVARDFQSYWESEFPQKTDDLRLSEEQAKKISKYVAELRVTLLAEVEEFKVYVVSPKRLEIKKLTEDVSILFSNGVYENIPQIAKNDFSEAGKCIAFERPTAAAFHLLRGTEAVLRYYYCEVIKTKRVRLQNWGEIIKDLKVKNKTRKKTELINNLDDIRVSYRNPTQHPQKIYDMDEVQNLWGRCTDVVDRMIIDLKLPKVKIAKNN
jgi:hypothetical protein